MFTVHVSAEKTCPFLEGVSLNVGRGGATGRGKSLKGKNRPGRRTLPSHVGLAARKKERCLALGGRAGKGHDGSLRRARGKSHGTIFSH